MVGDEENDERAEAEANWHTVGRNSQAVWLSG